MNGLRLAVLTLVEIAVSLGGSEPVRAQFYGGIGYGSPNGYNAGSFASGANSFNNWYVSPYGVYSPGYVGTNGNGFGYTRNYGQVPLMYGPGYGYGGYGIGPGYGGYGYGPAYGMGSPVMASPPVYGGATTVIRGGPGSVINYSNNGPGSPYPAPIPRQPALGLSRPYFPSSPPSVTIELPSQGSAYGLSNLSSASPTPSTRTGANIKLVCPKTAGGPLTYALNGHLYTIQPGYSQNFRDDRVWTLEFKQGGDGSEAVRYTLKPGTYNFAVGASGWELRQPVTAPTSDLPPAPIPELTTTPSSTPTPLPPP